MNVTGAPAAAILGANRAAIARLQPDFVLPGVDERFALVDGAWRLERDGRALTIHGRHPDREADRVAADLLDGSPADLVVVIGLGIGFLLDALERRGWTGKVLAIEPEPASLRPLLARREWQSWIAADRLRLLAGPDYVGAGDCGRWFGDGSVEPPTFVHPVLARVAPSAVDRARDVADRIRFGAKANSDARRKFGGRYVLNTLANLAAVAGEGDVATLAGAGSGLPAIVVAAGPSLDRNLEDLRAVADRAFIIAVDTALRPLLAAGIQPHLAVALDPGETNARHLLELPRCATTHLVAEASIDPAAIAAFRGRTFLFSVSNHEPWPWLQTHGAGRGQLRAWGSVVTSAFDLALQMGCNPIAFAGADLSFPGGQPYARGVAYEWDWRSLAAWGVPMEQQWRDQIDAWPHTEEPDVAGTLTRTAPHLIAFRNWLVDQIGREASRRIVNVTGAGILHGGRLEQMSLATLATHFPALPAPPDHLVRARYAPAKSRALLDAAGRLDQDEATIETWTRFADGLSRPLILAAVADAFQGRGAEPPLTPQPLARAGVELDAHWIQPLAATLPMVAMPLVPQRLEPHAEGVRRFRFRTTASWLIGCVLKAPDDAVTEDGKPLLRGTDIHAVAPGHYVIWRDQVYIASRDGTDPRTNGRAYALVVPETVAYLERLPLDQILAHGI